MDIGQLRHRVTFQKLVKIQDSFGQPIEQWDDVVTVWASVEPLVGKQYFDAETINSEISHKIKLRHRTGITPDMRIIFKARIFEIVSPPINYQERNIELQLMCKEQI